MTEETVAGGQARRVLEAAGIGLLLLGGAAYLAPRAGSAWDFDAFHYAATAFRRGLNPYDPGALTSVAGGIEQFPYLYPVSTLWLFVPFTWLSLGTATLVWLGLKLGLAAALLALWRRKFLSGTSWFALVAVAVFGFNGALLMDLRSGNVSVLEELLFWLALGHYLEDRRWPFAFLVAAASVFKVLPIVFLALLLVPAKRKGPTLGPALAGLALFGALAFLPPAWGLRWANGLLASGSVQRPMGEINPCALGMFDTLFYRPESERGAPALALGLWAAYCVALLWLSRSALRRAWEAREPLQWAVVGTTLYALLSPRMMVYSWILATVPALLLVRALFQRRGRAVAIALVVIQGIVLRAVLKADFAANLVTLPLPASLVLQNLPFLLMLGLWLGFVAAGPRVRLAGAGPDVAGDPAPASQS